MEKEIRVDGFLPPEMAEKMVNIGAKKAILNAWSTFALAILAGAFIAIGAEFCTLVVTDSGWGFGMTKLMGGLVFCIGLILVVVAGAELFTGNNLILMAWFSGKATLVQVLRNWAIVYAGNFVGSLGTAMIMYYTGQWASAGYKVGATALNIANAKVNLTFTEGLARGIMCNALVCIAVWLCMSGRTTTDKILAILFPITAFVASGFEHSIANMYFIPMGLFLNGNAEVIAAAGKVASDLVNLNTLGFLSNLIPVTIGNIFGGGFMVAVVYWLIYLRPEETEEEPVEAVARALSKL
jgi:formate/nitrite transporter